MVDTNKLRGVIAENGKTQADVAEMIGVTPKTFYMRMSKGVFGSDEIQVMIDNLHIQNPMDIFFAKLLERRCKNIGKIKIFCFGFIWKSNDC